MSEYIHTESDTYKINIVCLVEYISGRIIHVFKLPAYIVKRLMAMTTLLLKRANEKGCVVAIAFHNSFFILHRNRVDALLALSRLVRGHILTGSRLVSLHRLTLAILLNYFGNWKTSERNSSLSLRRQEIGATFNTHTINDGALEEFNDLDILQSP